MAAIDPRREALRNAGVFIVDGIEFIRKEALLEWLEKELERLWEIIPDADNENPTQMELRYLGEYMATERLIDRIKEM